MKEETTYHIPVLLMPSVDGMNIRPDGTYVDMTFGGGGHSREILSRLGEGGRLLGFDQDEDAEQNIVNDPHFTFVRSNFRYLHNFLRYHGIEQVDAILADLGVSSHHFDDSERGFSFRFDGMLDMRMNKRAGCRRYCKHLRGRTPCRYLLFVRGTKEQPQAGIRHSQSARHPADQYDRRFSGHHQAPLRTGKRKERTRKSISGIAH
jgi:hypothetical protein